MPTEKEISIQEKEFEQNLIGATDDSVIGRTMGSNEGGADRFMDDFVAGIKIPEPQSKVALLFARANETEKNADGPVVALIKNSVHQNFAAETVDFSNEIARNAEQTRVGNLSKAFTQIVKYQRDLEITASDINASKKLSDDLKKASGEVDTNKIDQDLAYCNSLLKNPSIRKPGNEQKLQVTLDEIKKLNAEKQAINNKLTPIQAAINQTSVAKKIDSIVVGVEAICKNGNQFFSKTPTADTIFNRKSAAIIDGASAKMESSAFDSKSLATKVTEFKSNLLTSYVAAIGNELAEKKSLPPKAIQLLGTDSLQTVAERQAVGYQKLNTLVNSSLEILNKYEPGTPANPQRMFMAAFLASEIKKVCEAKAPINDPEMLCKSLIGSLKGISADIKQHESRRSVRGVFSLMTSDLYSDTNKLIEKHPEFKDVTAKQPSLSAPENMLHSVLESAKDQQIMLSQQKSQQKTVTAEQSVTSDITPRRQ